MLANIKTKSFKIPAWKAKYPKTTNGNGNLFHTYQVYFVEGNKQTKLDFENACQLELFQFLNTTFDIKDCEIEIPLKEGHCKKVYQQIKHDYDKYAGQVASLLKSHRITANVNSIFKELLFA